MDSENFESQRISKLLPDIIKESTAAELLKCLSGRPFEAGGIQFYAFRRLFSFANSAKAANRAFNFRAPPWNLDSEIDLGLSKVISNLAQNIPSVLSLAIMSPFFEKISQAKSYVIQKDFFDMFRKVELGDLQMNHLPDDTCGFMSLPRPITDLQGNEFDGFFFYSGPSEKIFERTGFIIEGPKYAFGDKCVAFSYVSKGNLQVSYVIRQKPLDEKMRIADTFHGTTNILDGNQHTPIEGYPEHARIMFNLLAYLKSGTPDIRAFKNKINYLNKAKGKVSPKDSNLSRIDLVVVGWNFKKSPEYHKGQWSVENHIRKQRIGPGRTEFKLILINEQVRTRQKPLARSEESQDETN